MLLYTSAKAAKASVAIRKGRKVHATRTPCDAATNIPAVACRVRQCPVYACRAPLTLYAAEAHAEQLDLLLLV